MEIIPELTPQEFVDTLRKGASWLITQDIDADRLLLDVRDFRDEETAGQSDGPEHVLYYGPKPGEFPEISYQIFIEEVRRIVREKGA